MSKLRPGDTAGAGFAVRPSRAAGAVGVFCAVVALAGCSTTVQPKAVAAPVTTTSAQAPATSKATTPAPTTPTSVKPTGKDVDATVCKAVQTALEEDKTKAAADQADKKKLGADFKAAGTSLKTQAQKTKNADLKATLQKLGGYYDTLSANVLASKPTEAELKNIQTEGPHLDTLCPQES